MLIGNRIGQVRPTCHCLRKSNNSSVFSGKNAGKFSMNNRNSSKLKAHFYLILQVFKKHTHHIPQPLVIASELAISLRRWSNIDIWHAECIVFLTEIQYFR